MATDGYRKLRNGQAQIDFDIASHSFDDYGICWPLFYAMRINLGPWTRPRTIAATIIHEMIHLEGDIKGSLADEMSVRYAQGKVTGWLYDYTDNHVAPFMDRFNAEGYQ